MMSLVKRDLVLNKYPELVLIMLLVPVVYAIGLPPIFYMWYLLFPTLAINLFYYDDKSGINRFLIALPVSKKQIVRSRYMYLLALHTAALIYQWAFALFNIRIFTDMDYFVYSWKEAIVILSGFIMLTALVVPCYYAIRSFYTATVVLSVLVYGSLFVSIPFLARELGMGDGWIILNELDQGYVPILEHSIPHLPYLIVLLFTAVLFVVSMKFSEWIFSRQDH